jgi:hypothetical protein
LFVRKIDKIDIDNPDEGVRARPVFEIFPLAPSCR